MSAAVGEGGSSDSRRPPDVTGSVLSGGQAWALSTLSAAPEGPMPWLGGIQSTSNRDRDTQTHPLPDWLASQLDKYKPSAPPNAACPGLPLPSSPHAGPARSHSASLRRNGRTSGARPAKDSLQHGLRTAICGLCPDCVLAAGCGGV